MKSGIITLITMGMTVVERVLKKSDSKESREYLEQWKKAKEEAFQAERIVELEKQKPQEEQFDNVIEHFESKIKHLEKVAEMLEEMANKDLEKLLA